MSSSPLFQNIDAPLAGRISSLTRHLEAHSEFFPSPLGPIFQGERQFSLPRFACFGRGVHDESPRLALFAGLNAGDIRSSELLISYVEHLQGHPADADGLHLSFFPVVDVMGHLDGVARDWAADSWSNSRAPDMAALANELRNNRYHGFVRLETVPNQEMISASVQLAEVGGAYPAGVELISSAEFSPWEVRWETEGANGGGPLSLAEDLVQNPFEVRVRLPAHWSMEQQGDATVSILTRILQRFNADQAFAHHL